MADDGNQFKIVVMNAGGGQKGLLNGPRLRRDTLKAIIQNQNPQIIFFQELSLVQGTVENWLGAPYKYRGNAHAGIACNTRFFSGKQLKDGDLGQLLQNFDNDFQPLARLSALKMTDEDSGRKFLCISWHGPHNIEPQARLLWFEDLRDFLATLSDNYGLPLIVGGDFNIAAEDIEELVIAPFRIKYVADMLRPNTIDFYIISHDLMLNVLNFVDFHEGNPGFLDHRPLSATLIVPDPLEDLRFLFF